MLVLAMESSTSSAKALLYDPEKGVLDSERRLYGPELEQGGRSDGEGVYRLTVETAARLLERNGRRKGEIAAIGLCGTWHSLMVCDGSMAPAAPVFSWNFPGTAPFCEEIRRDEALTDRIYRETGCMPHGTYPRHALAYLRSRGMELGDKKLVTQGGYNFYRMTGRFLETACTQSGTGLIDLRTRDYGAFILDYLGIERGQLGELVSYRDVCPLGREAAGLLGLSAGIPVVPAHADGALNQIGNYAGRKGIMTMSVGTSGAVRVCADRPVLPEKRQLWCYCGAEGWISGAAVAGACNCVDWFMKKALGGRFRYGELEAEPEDVPVFLPFLYGERCPGWRDSRRGGFYEVSSEHSASDCYLALQMGILFNLYQCYECLSRECGEPEAVILSGGILNSPSWTQMAADIFGRELLTADCSNASSMGAAVLAMHAAGCLEDINGFREDFDRAVPVRCRSERRPYYQKQYERYLKAYGGYEK